MLVKMRRHPDFAHLVPQECDVHPAEVENYKAGGFLVVEAAALVEDAPAETPKRGRPRKVESE